MDCYFCKLLTGKLCLCSLKLELMALKNLVAKIYRCLHEVCTTFGASREVQLDVVLFTRFSLTNKKCYFMLNKLKDKLRSFTWLALISEQKMWPLTRKCTLTAFRFWTESRLQAVYQPFRKKFHPFKRLWSSVQKKLTSVRTAGLIRSKNLLIRSNGLSHPFRKNLHPFERLRSCVQKKISNRSNGSFHRSRNLLIHLNGLSHPFKTIISLSVRTAWVIRWAVQEKNKRDPLVRSNSSVSVQRKSSPFGRLQSSARNVRVVS